ncbi:MAG: OadG family protein [Spirochaetaceae bacterium]|jgi:oxaloacetate decarboxylase gamma subunit|nr:OadG family protein [Spirochaetaceae bacterium]
MTIAEMFGQSGVLALLGMGVVFGFLIVLIVCITVAGKVIHALGLDKETSIAKSAPAIASGSSVNAPIAAAISAAVHQYKK